MLQQFLLRGNLPVLRSRSEFVGRRCFPQYILVGTFARPPCEYFMNIFALRLIREQTYSYLVAGSPAVYVYILLCIRVCMCMFVHNTYLPETPMRVVERVGKRTHSAKVSLSLSLPRTPLRIVYDEGHCEMSPGDDHPEWTNRFCTCTCITKVARPFCP